MQTTKSVIISCAGIGSRLGLGTTKALIKIDGKSIIQWQLELFQEVKDIAEVKKYRPDAVFVYNHNYFDTKTGTSYYLGARHGAEYAVEIDGDLLIHPEDAKMLLELDGEWIAYADKSSEDGVYVKVNEAGEVIGFSRQEGDYEWTGPCCLKRENIIYSSENVFNQLESHLPMRGIKIRARDIDTYNDYINAIEFIKTWR